MEKKAMEEKRKTKAYLPLICLAGGMAALTLFLIGPLELYLSNANEFWFDLFGAESYLLLFFLALFAVFLGLTVLIGYLLPESGRPYLICVVFGIGLALYLQANFLNGDMGALNGQDVNWWSDPVRVLLNSAIWILCVAVPILGYVFLRKYWKGGITLLSLMVIVMQLASVLSLGFSQHHIADEVRLSTDQIFTLSDKENIVVFVVDTLDAQYFESDVMDDPAFAGQLNDFQYFNNAVSGGGPTIYGMPVLLTGTYYQGEPYRQYIQTAYEGTNFYQKLQEHGYDTRICTVDRFVDDNFYTQYVDNAQPLKVTSNSKVGLLMKLYQLVGYKYFPMAVKNPFYLYTGEFDQFQQNVSDAAGEPYTQDDAKFIQSYRDQGLTVIDAPGTFRLYHLFGAHSPYTLKADGTTDGQETSRTEQIHGVMGMICEYMDEMRELGLYDHSTIVIAADHGVKDIYQNPAFLIKPADVTQESMTISHAPITYENVLPTLSQAIDGVNNEKNRTVFEVGEDERPTRYQVVEPSLVRQYYGDGVWTSPVLFSVGLEARDTSALVDLGGMETMKPVAEYRLGDTIIFTEEHEEGQVYLYQGFCGLGEVGTWTEGPEAIQRMSFQKQPKKNLQVDIQLYNIYSPPQYVTVYFNGHCVYSQLVSDPEITFRVPREAVAEGEQEIRYVMSTKSPAEISDSTDVRHLSLRFQSMRISETKEDAVEVTPVNTYTLGDDIVFTEADDGRRYFTSGVAGIEKDSAWSLGASGQMRLIVGDVTQDLVGEFQFKTIYGPPQRLVVTSKGKTLYDADIETADTPVTFPIPASCVDGGELVLDLEYPNAKSPASGGNSSDMRMLAFRFYNIRFYEKGTSTLVDLGGMESTKPITEYRLGDTMIFTLEHLDSQVYLYQGFSGLGEVGTWTEEPEAIQKLSFQKQPKKNLQVDIQLYNIYSPPQYVTVYFNGHCVYSQLVSDPEITFRVPREAVAEGEQEIRYVMSTKCPAEISDSTDGRRLSLRFQSMRISETDEDASEVTPINTYTLGDDIVFTEADDGRRYFTSGIAGLEKDSAWSLGASGQMRLIVGDVTQDLVGEFQFKTIYGPPQRLVVTSKGKTLYDADIETADTPVTFPIPASCVDGGELVLGLEYPNAKSPASGGNSSDMRMLAFRFYNIRVYEESAASAAPTQGG